MDTRTHAFRLPHGVDLRKAIEHYVTTHNIRAGAIVTCVGGLSTAILRMPGAATFSHLDGDFEIVSIEGTLSANGSHIHLSLSDIAGTVKGGHLDYGSMVRLTAEVILMENLQLVFSREFDPETGYCELKVEQIQTL
ncbi:PPC domain-containing DNA-binding protein [Streptomyces sp. NPDC057621]|uniref:PPC domain-containing DNA-binding protein n=1 Tax=Streptomyces sp. NPDC057621 TaxID=3346186 RepID=UPI0036B53D56